MQTKAMLKSVFWKPLVTAPAVFAVVSSMQKLNTSEARMKPTTNFGNLSQMTPTVGLSA